VLTARLAESRSSTTIPDRSDAPRSNHLSRAFSALLANTRSQETGPVDHVSRRRDAGGQCPLSTPRSRAASIGRAIAVHFAAWARTRTRHGMRPLTVRQCCHADGMLAEQCSQNRRRGPRRRALALCSSIAVSSATLAKRTSTRIARTPAQIGRSYDIYSSSLSPPSPYKTTCRDHPNRGVRSRVTQPHCCVDAFGSVACREELGPDYSPYGPVAYISASRI